MSTPRDEGYAGVAELPPYRSMLVVDMKDYSGNPGRYQTELTTLIPEIMAAAFQRCGLPSVWDRRTFHTTTGDGYAIRLPTEVLPFLLNPYLASLQEELEERNRDLHRGRYDAVRMRVSVSVGPVADSGRNVTGDGSGAARVELHRLLDSEPVRDLLTRSDGDVTFVAAIISSRVYEDAVLSGYADEPSSQYVPAPVVVKTYEGLAYLRVPRPSGGLLRRGFRPDAKVDGTPDSRTSPPSAAAPTQINDHTGVRHGGIGNIAGGVGTLISGSSGPVHTGSGHQYARDLDREAPR